MKYPEAVKEGKRYMDNRTVSRMCYVLAAKEAVFIALHDSPNDALVLYNETDLLRVKNAIDMVLMRLKDKKQLRKKAAKGSTKDADSRTDATTV